MSTIFASHTIFLAQIVNILEFSVPIITLLLKYKNNYHDATQKFINKRLGLFLRYSSQ